MPKAGAGIPHMPVISPAGRIRKGILKYLCDSILNRQSPDRSGPNRIDLQGLMNVSATICTG
jgi:hypothetical protein